VTEILMPRLSDTMETGVVMTWLKHPGDRVEPGDVLAEIETDKAVMEFEAYQAGTLSRIVVAEGEEAPIGAPIAVLDDGTPSNATSSPAPPSPVVTYDADRPPASPLARLDAREHGIDLGTVEGTGPGGRIIRADVLAAIHTASRPIAEPPARPPVAEPPGAADPVRMGQLRRTIGRRMTESFRDTPHFSLTAVVDVEEAVAYRADLNARLTEHGRDPISLNDLVVRAAALALRAHPAVNASAAPDAVLRHQGVHVGIAVATEQGLLVPVVRDADTKTVSRIAQESRDLARRARERTLEPAELTGSTFTVSNLGMYGVEQFTAIINPPEAAILAVGAAKPEPAVLPDGTIAARTRMRCTLSADHRVLDGAEGAEFLRTLTGLLEAPVLVVA
jgi:pyruvate dehydrogenase E2 component (dihydrolipoyllysine-residue acetyltransferase)